MRRGTSIGTNHQKLDVGQCASSPMEQTPMNANDRLFTAPRCLTPFAIALLWATSGCTTAVDGADFEADSIDGTARQGVTIELQPNNDKRVVPWRPSDVNEANPATDEPTPGADASNGPKIDLDDDTPVLPPSTQGTQFELSKLSQSQLDRVVDAIVFATPARVDRAVSDTSFMNFDAAGAVTTSNQRLTACHSARIDQASGKLVIEFDCSHLGGNAPDGVVRCSADYLGHGQLEFWCNASFTSAQQTTSGELAVQYSAANGHTQIDSRFRAGELEVGGRYWIDQKVDNGAACQLHSGHVTIASERHTRTARMFSLERCNNRCRPNNGRIIFDVTDHQRGSTYQLDLQGMESQWSSNTADAAGSDSTTQLCQ